MSTIDPYPSGRRPEQRTRAITPLAGILAMLSVSSSAGAERSVPNAIHFALAPEIEHGSLTGLRVRVGFRANASGITDFGWDNSWAGERRLWQWARDVAVVGAEALERNGDGRWRILSKPGASLTVTYRIVSAYDGDPTITDTAQAKPVIRPRWFYAAGSALFGRPDHQDDRPATFDWSPVPGMGFASDLEHLAGQHRRAIRPGTVTDALESIVIGGRDMQLFAPTGRTGVRVATIGRYAFTPEAMDRLVRNVIAAERNFWKADRTAPFLVTLGPIAGRKNATSYSGTGRSDAFALWVDDRTRLDPLKWLLAHEYFHSWNPDRLGALPSDQAAWPTQYWLSEGFTDYYARALLVRTGLISPSEFVGQWNEMLAAYANSQWRTSSGMQTAAAFWDDDSARAIPYQRGAMLAAIWNARLLKSSRGDTNLDSVLRSQAALARRSKGQLTSLFRAEASKYGLMIAADEARYIRDGGPILLPRDTFGACATVITEDRPEFARGYNAQATSEAGNVASGVDPRSIAYAAGLRDGMRIIRRTGGRQDDAMTPFVLTVEEAGRTRNISYLPQGLRRVAIQRLELTPRVSPACRLTLGGLPVAEGRRRMPTNTGRSAAPR